MRTSSPVTVGRTAETSLLRRTLTRLHGDGGRSVFLVGEAGIGKSRLVDDCAGRAVAAGLPVLRGRSSTTGADTPFRPLVEALYSCFHAGGPPGDPELLPYRPALGRLVPEWRSAAGPGYAESVVELAEALLRLLAVVGRRSGCVLALEDLHDADAETVGAVEYLVDHLDRVPVLLVATLRPEPGNALDLVRGAERRRVASVAELPPLTTAEVGALAAGCLGVPVARVPSAVVARLAERSGGNPYLVEELLAELVGSDALRRDGDGWRVTGDLTATVPAGVVHGCGLRLGRLAAPVRELLLTAATLGPRFSVDCLQLVTGDDDPGLFARLRAAAEADFIVPDPGAPEGYGFRHAITAQAVLESVAPAERAALARRAAAALRKAGPPYAADHGRLVARLLVAAGDHHGAALLYAEAGRQALAEGASASAVRLLERAVELAAPTDRTAVTESLAYALVEAGRLDRALALADDLPKASSAALSPEREVALRTRLAWAAVVAERGPDTVTQVSAARALLHDGGRPEQTAALAVVEGHLALLPGERDRVDDAERIARETAEEAERTGPPVLACQALQLLALLARERGFDAADACLERMLAVAETHGLPNWRFEALLRLGANAFLRTGDARRLEQAGEAARELGSLVRTQHTESLLAMNAVLRGDPATAETIVDRWLDTSLRMGNLATHRYLRLTSATLAAHRGRRRDMERELRLFRQAGGDGSLLTPVVLGLCRAVCALLEEDRAGAEAELAATAEWEARHPSVFYLSGRYGLDPLLAVLAGRAGWAEYEAVAGAPGAELAWNRPFLALARAVLLGRRGRGAEAAAEVERLRQDPDRFPTAHRLGLRLVAEAALADGWGDPVSWLRTAEEYFHELDVPSVAGACRALLRQAGASVGQRRTGRDRIPAALRERGVTPREYEVLALLVDRPGNQDLARRLSISPRTVEKHLASLVQKTGAADRGELCRLAAELAPDRRRP
ncbi:helix-turn-helix transcriptional regulator [Kitasatospora xanthocidica]|uniref:helix-turn-helix transcriptional regulator n=1 Tax=Kitasatospora xanthocidica TaxID=83382 RepID=UPI0016718F60|nr:LuxR family transcriptional regulator [Kitasatospora xanthocidica]